MRRLLIACAFAGGCHGAQCDPEALLAREAGPDAIGCGAYNGLGEPVASPEAVRVCVKDARAARRPFWASIDQNVADGRALIGWASDGARVVEVDYDAIYSMGIGSDQETVREFTCLALGDRGPSCASYFLDLCLICGDAMAVPVRCP